MQYYQSNQGEHNKLLILRIIKSVGSSVEEMR